MSDATETLSDDPARARILHAPLGLAVLRLGVPLALAMVLQVLFNLVDQYLIAKLPPAVADASIDALGFCDMVAALGTIVSYGVSTATATILAQHLGANETRKVSHVAWGSVGLVLMLGMAFGLVGVVGADVIVHDLLGAKGQVRELGRDYLRIMLGGSASVFLMFQIGAIYRSLGDTRLPLMMFAGGNVLNLVLAVLMVYGPGDAPFIFSWGPPIARVLGIPRMEVLGAAWATIIARGVACMVPFFMLRARLKVRERGATLRPPREVVRAIVGLAWPTSAQFVVRVLAVLLVSAIVHHVYTTTTNSDAGTAYALCLRLETMALFVSMGWGGCAQTFTGMCLGAGMHDRAVRAGWLAMLYNGITMAVLALLYRTLGEDLLRVFTQSPPILALAVEYLGTVGPSYVFYGIAIVLGNAMIGAGATRLALRVDTFLVGVVQTPILLLVTVAFAAQITTLWFALVAVNVINAVLYIGIFRRRALWQRSTLVSAP